ncbi:hypothetical protein M1614_02205 [Candidatus Marsarchaeota archaeon]|nr:hypothetical protein [Candidatus Marsarchaeota archaeon]
MELKIKKLKLSAIEIFFVLLAFIFAAFIALGITPEDLFGALYNYLDIIYIAAGLSIFYSIKKLSESAVMNRKISINYAGENYAEKKVIAREEIKRVIGENHGANVETLLDAFAKDMDAGKQAKEELEFALRKFEKEDDNFHYRNGRNALAARHVYEMAMLRGDYSLEGEDILKANRVIWQPIGKFEPESLSKFEPESLKNRHIVILSFNGMQRRFLSKYLCMFNEKCAGLFFLNLCGYAVIEDVVLH